MAVSTVMRSTLSNDKGSGITSNSTKAATRPVAIFER